MANTKILGKAVVVTSSIKFEDLKTIKKYRPNALTLKGGEDGKEPIFTIFVREDGKCGISDNGISFCEATRDENKFATLTFTLNNVPEDIAIKDVVVDELGGALAKLNKLEEQLTAVLGEINAEREAVSGSIDVIS